MGYPAPTLVAGPRKHRPSALLLGSASAHFDEDSPTRHYSVGYNEEVPVRRTFIDFGSLAGASQPDSPRASGTMTAPARMGGLSVQESFENWKVVTSTDPATPSAASCSIVAGDPSNTVATDCSLERSRQTLKAEWARPALSAGGWHCCTERSKLALEAALQKTLKGAEDLPDVTYRLSPISMKAAGYTTTSAPRTAPRSPRDSGTPDGPYSPMPDTPSPRTPTSPSDPRYCLQNNLWKDALGPNGVVPKSVKHPDGLDKAAWSRLYAQFQPPPGRRPPVLLKPPAREKNSCCEVVEEREKDDAESSDDEDSSDEDLGLCPTYAVDAPLPSSGSALHSDGTCKRCCFFPKGRCNNGYDCQFCHFAHEKRKPKNKKKKKKKRKYKLGSTGQTPKCLPSAPAVLPPRSPSVQQVFGDASMHWAQPRDRPSQLVCHGLNFVPSTAHTPGAVMPGHSIINTQQAPMVYAGQSQQWHSLPY